MEVPCLPPVKKVVQLLEVHYLNEVGLWTDNLIVCPFL